ncbi:enoyl-CoA hydratase/isomerase family protein [Streptomyces tubercidicus]|uniref:Enoyl-CoA hydratase n=1 Tax=Streptomyces tubercidicus TaxID=47759 RepID=A0A640V4R8_9ACTN|nr:enoyl-CoA hydratase/isomerase family protein [Streptomyces tubercidicus]WAU16060.1 enoyl-CoA hydratase/isomerase family protein [Streptomyces tubercidicus]GFE41971.1 enoyl-CoA hydratase [Streptomyces tubercidicus]
MTTSYETISTSLHGNVLSATFHAPPINLIGPEVVRDLVGLLEELSHPAAARVVVFDSADPDFFFPHVDLTKVPEYTAEAAKAGGPGDASLGMLFHQLSQLPAVTIAKLRGRARGAGSEFLLACDMRFASRENAVLGQLEVGIGAPPGAGAIQHLTRLLGRGRALEAVLTSADFDAELAERYGWINRAVPDAELDEFVAGIAGRMADFPRDALIAAKSAINAISLPTPADVRADAAMFQQLVRGESSQERTAALFQRGLQTRGRAELELGDVLGELSAVD